MSGRVEVNWELQPHSLLLRWTESGGPRPQAPAAPGFGIRMISASIERQLAGEAAFHWRPEGLHCSVCVPRGDSIEPLAHRTGAHWTVGEDRSALPLQLETGNRVLLVEDEILVAMMMKDILTELGFSVIGPFSRLAEAMVAHPWYVRGTAGPDTDLMERAGGRLVAKGGAEGVLCIAVRDAGLGLALKVESGRNEHAHAVAIDALRQLGVLGPAEVEAMGDLAHPPVRNHRGLYVGQARPVVKLISHQPQDEAYN